MRIENRWEEMDKAVLEKVLLRMKICPKCRMDLLPVALSGEKVFGCKDCKETWFIED